MKEQFLVGRPVFEKIDPENSLRGCALNHESVAGSKAFFSKRKSCAKEVRLLFRVNSAHGFILYQLYHFYSCMLPLIIVVRTTRAQQGFKIDFFEELNLV